eukprot:8026161-Pyramimonas_sp.AAC.1
MEARLPRTAARVSRRGSCTHSWTRAGSCPRHRQSALLRGRLSSPSGVSYGFKPLASPGPRTQEPR